MKYLNTVTAWLPVALVLGTSEAVAQSARAFERANCNASFMGCSGGGSAAPFGDMGSSGLEVLLIVAAIFLFAWRPMLRRLSPGK